MRLISRIYWTHIYARFNNTPYMLERNCQIGLAESGMLSQFRHANAIGWTAANGWTHGTEYLISCGIDVTYNHNIAAKMAVEGGNIHDLILLLQNGGNVYECIIMAAQFGHLHIIKFLHFQGVPLYTDIVSNAARHGWIDIVSYCVESYIKEEKSRGDILRHTKEAIVLAAKHGWINVVRYLLRNVYNEPYYDGPDKHEVIVDILYECVLLSSSQKHMKTAELIRSHVSLIARST